MIDRNSPLPIYYQLKSIIKEQIESGVLRPGDRLPTELVLCSTYNMSRAPVRQALLDLVQEGFIYRRAGQGTFVAARDTEPPDPRTILRLLAYDARWVALMELAVRQWNLLHPDRGVRLQLTMPEQAEFHQTLLSTFRRGEVPELVSIDYVWVTHYARLGYLAPVDALDPDFSKWLTTEMEEPVLRNHVVDGLLYGLPIQADVTGFWYRKDWFQSEGQQPPETWEQWKTLLTYFDRPEVKKRLGHRYATAFPVSTTTGEATLNLLLPFIWAAGGTLQDEEGHLTLKDAAIPQALDFLHSLVGYLPQDTSMFHWWDPPRMLARGKVAMTLGGSYEWPTIFEESDWDDETEMVQHLGFVPIPRPTLNDKAVTSLGGTTWAIPRQAEPNPLLMEILRLVMSPEIVLPFCERNLQISSLRSVNARLLKGEHSWMRTVIPLLVHSRPRPMLPEYVQVSRFLQQMFEQVVWQGGAAQEAVTQTAHYLALLLGE